MQLKQINIYETFMSEEPLRGEVTFKNSAGVITINLTQEQLSGVLSVIADALVASVQQVALDLKANVIQSAAQVPALGAPSVQVP